MSGAAPVVSWRERRLERVPSPAGRGELRRQGGDALGIAVGLWIDERADDTVSDALVQGRWRGARPGVLHGGDAEAGVGQDRLAGELAQEAEGALLAVVGVAGVEVAAGDVGRAGDVE